MGPKNLLQIKTRLHRTAKSSPSRYRISGIAMTKKGEILGITHNSFRRENINGLRRGSGKHCEARLIERYRDNIKTIMIMRIGNAGDIRPIDPCEHCQALAKKYGIQILTVSGSKTKEI